MRFRFQTRYAAVERRRVSRSQPARSAQRKLRLFFAHSPPPREASQIDDPPKDRWDNITFPLDI